VDDSEGYYQTLQRAIAQMRTQLAFMPPDDSRREGIYRDLLWCYHEAFTLLYRRIVVLGQRRIAAD
jgi:hypothetical protein